MATSMEYNTVQKLREVPLMTTKGQVITLQDIANVTTASKDASSISRYNGQDNVSIGIKNKSSAGTVNACKDVKEKLQQIQAENPAIEFEVTYDASSSIISSLTSVAETLLLGVVLTMAVLFLFFGDFKASLIVGASMPISLFLTLILMSMMGFTGSETGSLRGNEGSDGFYYRFHHYHHRGISAAGHYEGPVRTDV